jgi:hypothetical protein
VHFVDGFEEHVPLEGGGQPESVLQDSPDSWQILPEQSESPPQPPEGVVPKLHVPTDDVGGQSDATPQGVVVEWVQTPVLAHFWPGLLHTTFQYLQCPAAGQSLLLWQVPAVVEHVPVWIGQSAVCVQVPLVTEQSPGS